MNFLRLLFLPLFIILIMPVSALSKPMSLPGGASSIQETFSDWRVVCSVQGNLKRCSLSQRQFDKESNKLVLAFELDKFPASGEIEGIAVLPFGLILEKGIFLQVDSKHERLKFGFNTCLPSGCIVRVLFSKEHAKLLRAGNSIKVTAVGDDGTIPFNVSLLGFSKALDRVKTLSKYK